MDNIISQNTQAILLLTAPLIVGSSQRSTELLTQTEYNRVARVLNDQHRTPADLLGPESNEILKNLQSVADSGRFSRLLGRGFLLSQALERWQTRSIWVISRADPNYPLRLKERLKDSAPSILFGCGDESILETGGLAVVGSREVDERLINYTEKVGRLAAKAQQTIVSGGARGIDKASMFGALQVEGRVIGVLADSLERLALSRDCREYLMEKRLVLISPYDPAAGFDVGHAMQRNKIIYALSEAALVVNSDFEKGGTWGGAIEQLEKLHLVPVYVRSEENSGKGLKALLKKGALPWPNPEFPDELINLLQTKTEKTNNNAFQKELPLYREVEITAEALALKPKEDKKESILAPQVVSEEPIEAYKPSISITPAIELFAKVKEIVPKISMPTTDIAIAEALQVSKKQAATWLGLLVKEGILKKTKKPPGYILASEKQNKLC